MKKKMRERLDQNWISTAQMAEALGVCTKTLYRLRDSGCLKPGKHYLIVSPSFAVRPTYRWHQERCEAAMGVSLECR
jgi:hypothetical protein